MFLFIRVPGCTRRVFMDTFKLTQPRMLWLDQRLTSSVAFPRVKPMTTIRVTPLSSISVRGKHMSALPCSPWRGLHTPAGRARTTTHTQGAFASSSAASTPSPAEPTVRATTVPLQDVKRILKLAQTERWRLTGNVLCLFNFWPLQRCDSSIKFSLSLALFF